MTKWGTFAARVALVALLLVAGGCATHHEKLQRPFAAGGTTQFSKNNFRVVKPHAEATSYGFSLLFGMISVVQPTASSAMGKLNNQFESDGKAVVLVETVEDRTTMNFLLFSIPRIDVSAKAIEFLDEK